MEKLYKAWRDYDVAFLYLYTREPHPGFYDKPQTKTLKERMANAGQCEKELGMTLPWIIDDMKSTIQRAYGGLPNCAYIITSEGKVFYKEAWADASNLDRKLKELYGSDPKFKAKAAAHVKNSILSEKDASRRAELSVRLARLACEDACKELLEVFKKEVETEIRASMAKALAYTKQKRCIEFLVSLLGDSKKEIRSAAIKTLEKLTGERLGFEPAAEEKTRTESVARWNDWWDSNKDKLVWSEEAGRFAKEEE